jgi:hypothetical protein
MWVQNVGRNGFYPHSKWVAANLGSPPEDHLAPISRARPPALAAVASVVVARSARPLTRSHSQFAIQSPPALAPQERSVASHRLSGDFGRHPAGGFSWSPACGCGQRPSCGFQAAILPAAWATAPSLRFFHPLVKKLKRDKTLPIFVYTFACRNHIFYPRG